MAETYQNAAHLIHATRARAFAPRKVQTVSEFADKEIRLSKKGSAEPGPWHTDRNPPLREPMDCMSARSTVKEVVMMFPIQFGKALALDTPIPTPNGWTMMGDIKAGDIVFDKNGKLSNVTFASEVFYDHVCYRVTFSDKSQIIADAGHIWSVDNSRYSHRIEYGIKKTTQEIAGDFKFRKHNFYAIPVTGALDLPDIDLPIDPYTLGAWLGDGNSYGAQLTLYDLDVNHIVSRIEEAGYYCEIRKLKHYELLGTLATNVMIDPRGSRSGICLRGHVLSETGVKIRINKKKPFNLCSECRRQFHKKYKYGIDVDPVINQSFHWQLNANNLLNNKHIPAIYLRSSIKQRLSLLHGLMDTDGSIDKNGNSEIASVFPELALGIIELIRSLGFKPHMKLQKTAAKDQYRIRFLAYSDKPIFTLPRKLIRQPEREGRRSSASTRRRIIAVDLIESVPTRCISVDSYNHLFLAGRAMIPTHNTSVAINALAYFMAYGSGPVMVCLPGEVGMNKWINQRLNPCIEETPAVQEVLTSQNSRNSANTKEFKDFIGGQLYLEHAGSPSRLKSTSVKFLIVDELTEFAGNLVTGDDPLMLLEDRTSAFPATYKRLYISSPGVKGICRTDELYEKSDQRKYFMPCPHCNSEILFEWSGLHWSEGSNGHDARYVCPECACEIEEHHKTEMIKKGRWIATNPGPKLRGYHINALYYQIGLGPRWATLVEMWLQAYNDLARLKSFLNSRLAITWEDPAMRAVKMNVIADRVEPYALRTAPVGVCVITAGVDTQDNRLAVHITGWGKGMAAWTIDYVELMGDPADDAVWVALTDLLNRPILHVNGHKMPIEATAIDAGGHRTEAVKDYVRRRHIRRPMVIFGAIPNNAPVLSKPKAQDINWRGQIIKKGVYIQHVGTVAIKNVLFGRLATDHEKTVDERRVHFSSDLQPDYFQGITSETFDPRANRFIKKRGIRNEHLDTWVYSYAAAHHQELRLHLHTKAKWDELLEKYGHTLTTADRNAELETWNPTPTPKPLKKPKQNSELL